MDTYTIDDRVSANFFNKTNKLHKRIIIYRFNNHFPPPPRRRLNTFKAAIKCRPLPLETVAVCEVERVTRGVCVCHSLRISTAIRETF